MIDDDERVSTETLRSFIRVPFSSVMESMARELLALREQAWEPRVYQCPRCATAMEVDLTAKPSIPEGWTVVGPNEITKSDTPLGDEIDRLNAENAELRRQLEVMQGNLKHTEEIIISGLKGRAERAESAARELWKALRLRGDDCNGTLEKHRAKYEQGSKT